MGTSPNVEHVLTLDCPEAPGIVLAVSRFLVGQAATSSTTSSSATAATATSSCGSGLDALDQELPVVPHGTGLPLRTSPTHGAGDGKRPRPVP
ncbi:hypothetical protein ADK57_28295 [Streptomyces sp. MMG1533]|uniref:hypothetical protein n=1 Tax=Streptomyces sp. MMG1533 TaxID=1415546 RepID=UPI0006AE3762|nr:hypothetical protein [Streptomyces sp. MMG1533]KOU61234.1 hypothetical protein ADK57_28295 [Streptomyces sp. MMG1533]